MYKEDNQRSTMENIQPDEIQSLIDQRMAYLIEREKEEADRIKSASKASHRFCLPNSGFSRLRSLFRKSSGKDD